MKPQELNFIFRVFDALLSPFMWILGGFTFPVQETHPWHVKKWKWQSRNGLPTKEKDSKATFGHKSPLGLFHMPILGGLTKYVVIEASGFNKFWYIGWRNHIQLLKIKQNRVMLLVGKKGFEAFGLGDNRNELNLKIVAYGVLGDKKFTGLRLF